MLTIPPLQRRCLGATFLCGALVVGLPRAWAALEPAPAQVAPIALGGPQVRVLLREAPSLTLRAPAGSRLRLRDGAGQVLMDLGPGQPLRLQLAGSQVVGQAEAVEGASPSGPSAFSPSRAPSSPLAAAASPTAPVLYDSATGSPVLVAPAATAAAQAAPPNPSPAPAPGLTDGLLRSAPAQRLRASELVVESLAEPGREGSVWLQKHRYRGALWIRPQGDALQAVNLVGLETYLASVVGSEMPASWPLEALRAQAVAARTYALRALRPGPGRAYDLKATVASQMYLGVEAETASTQAAVAGTRGMVLTYGDGLIEAVFHSSGGGLTENSGELWGQQLPYLVSVADFDSESPVRDWRVPLSDELVRKGFPEIGSLERIEVLSSSSSGRVRQARVVGSAGAVVVTGAELRSRLGLKSTLVQFSREPINALLPSDQVGIPSPQLPGAAPSSAAGFTPSLLPSPQGAGVAAGAGTPGLRPPAAALASASSAAPGALPVASLYGPGTASASAPLLVPPPLPDPDARAATPRFQWVAIGHGFGHGIGMSQWGACAMAKRGEGFEQILQHYYRGTQLRPYASLAALAPVLQPRLSSGFGLGSITGRAPAFTLGATP